MRFAEIDAGRVAVKHVHPAKVEITGSFLAFSVSRKDHAADREIALEFRWQIALVTLVQPVTARPNVHHRPVFEFYPVTRHLIFLSRIGRNAGTLRPARLTNMKAHENLEQSPAAALIGNIAKAELFKRNKNPTLAENVDGFCNFISMLVNGGQVLIDIDSYFKNEEWRKLVNPPPA